MNKGLCWGSKVLLLDWERERGKKEGPGNEQIRRRRREKEACDRLGEEGEGEKSRVRKNGAIDAAEEKGRSTEKGNERSKILHQTAQKAGE